MHSSSISKARGKSNMLIANNPIFIITAAKNAGGYNE